MNGIENRGGCWEKKEGREELFWFIEITIGGEYG